MEAEAKFLFAASQEDELSFEKGTIVNVSVRRFALRASIKLAELDLARLKYEMFWNSTSFYFRF